MTRFENRTASEQMAVNQSRREEGKPPFGSSSRRVQANVAVPFVQTIVAQNFASTPSGFAAEYVNAIAVRLGKKRFTKPSTELGN
jgi:hypothetical protein